VKFEVRIPMLSLAGGANKTSPPTKEPKDMKDKDGTSSKEKGKRKELANMQKSQPEWKPPTKTQLHKEAVHSEVRNSMREWVGGRKTTKEHQKTVDRAKLALKMGHSGKQLG
jgi:hypothetical protein